MKQSVQSAPNIIMLCPFYQCEESIGEWAKYIEQLETKPSRIIFCENNSSDLTLEKIWNLKIKDVDIEVIRFYTVNMKDKKLLPFSKCYDIIAHARQLLLTKARILNPDYAIFVDSDIYLIDPTTLESLTLWDKDIIGGMYRRVFPTGVFIATLFYENIRLREKSGWVKLRKFPMGVPLMEVHSTSGGLLCLSRKVIQDRRLSFYPVPNNFSEDFGFCNSARELGYSVWVDGTINVGHKISLKWRAWDVIREKDDERSKAFDEGTLIEDLKREREEKIKMLKSKDKELEEIREKKRREYAKKV